MADRRRGTGLAMVVAMSLGPGAELACGGDSEGRPPAWKEPRDAEIRETLDAVWQAIGLRPEQVNVAEYAYTFAPDNTACAALESDDRWFGERGSSAVAEGRGQAEIEDAIVAYLEGEGFTVQRYRSTHPDSPARSLQGDQGRAGGVRLARPGLRVGQRALGPVRPGLQPLRHGPVRARPLTPDGPSVLARAAVAAARVLVLARVAARGVAAGQLLGRGLAPFPRLGREQVDDGGHDPLGVGLG